MKYMAWTNVLHTAGCMLNRPKQKQRGKSEFSRRTFPILPQILCSFSSFKASRLCWTLLPATLEALTQTHRDKMFLYRVKAKTISDVLKAKRAAETKWPNGGRREKTGCLRDFTVEKHGCEGSENPQGGLLVCCLSFCKRSSLCVTHILVPASCDFKLVSIFGSWKCPMDVLSVRGCVECFPSNDENNINNNNNMYSWKQHIQKWNQQVF